MYSQALQQDCKQNAAHKTDCKNYLEKFMSVRGLVWREVFLLNNCYFYSPCDISSENWWYIGKLQATKYEIQKPSTSPATKANLLRDKL